MISWTYVKWNLSVGYVQFFCLSQEDQSFSLSRYNYARDLRSKKKKMDSESDGIPVNVCL